MHKRFTKNVQYILAQIKKTKGNDKLNKIDALKLIELVSLQKGSLGKAILDSMGANIEDIFPVYGKLSQNEKISADELLKIASKIAYLTKSPYVGTEHLVHGFFSLPQNTNLIKIKDVSKKINDSMDRKDDFDRPDFFGEVHSIIDNFFAPDGMPLSKKSNVLENYCHELNYSSKKQQVLVGRKNELERISHVLGRKMKNNPVLIGEPGVGKTAIVEGLAQKISQGKAPYYLIGKRIFSLDLGSLIAGTTFRGEFEARLKEVIKAAERNSDAILFVDEIHNLIGAGNAVGGMDAANLLKPAMSRGEIQIIGATTFDEYQKHILKDSALERRFQPIMISEPNQVETLEILRGIRPNYEKYHNVRISDEALYCASALAKRYITDRFLPDSAIDLIDEAAARLRSRNSNSQVFEQIKVAEKKYNKILAGKEALVIADQYEQAIQMRHEEKIVLENLKELRRKLHAFEQKNQVCVSDKDIKTTLSEVTNIPKELLSQQGGAIARKVKSVLRDNLIGQTKAHKEIHNAVLRQVSGITNPNRPLGSFLFIGPTGIGKTYTAKLLSEAIALQGGKSLIQINMSEFSQGHNISRLLGAPAGYVGYEESGELTRKIRKNPYSVVLFDEIEKAELSILNILLQILEEGEVTDAKGRVVNFRNTIVILTSNIGTSELDSALQIGFTNEMNKMKREYEKTKENILEQLREILAPELLNRLDSTIIFDPLSKQQMTKIASKELELLANRVIKRNIDVNYSKDLVSHIAQLSQDEKQGARSIRHTIQNEIEPLIAQKILSRKKISTIYLKLKNGKIGISTK